MKPVAVLASRGRVGKLTSTGEWVGEPTEFVDYLNSAYRSRGTGVDVLFPPGYIAFWRAVSDLKADVKQAPPKTPVPEGALS
jgi:hypothetical protein